MQHVERHEMQIIVDLALAGEIAEHIGDAVIGIAGLEAPGFFKAPAEFRIVEPGFAAEQPELEAEIARLDPGKCSAITRSSTAG